MKIDVTPEEVIDEIPIVDTVNGGEHVGEVMRRLAVTHDGTVHTAGSYTDHRFKYERDSDKKLPVSGQ